MGCERAIDAYHRGLEDSAPGYDSLCFGEGPYAELEGVYNDCFSETRTFSSLKASLHLLALVETAGVQS